MEDPSGAINRAFCALRGVQAKLASINVGDINNNITNIQGDIVTIQQQIENIEAGVGSPYNNTVGF